MEPPRIYLCADWGAQQAKKSAFGQRRALGIVIHNTESPNRAPGEDRQTEWQLAKQLARSIQQSHFARGWDDTGQHFLVTRGGLLLEGRHGSAEAARRGYCVQGSHTGVTLYNRQWFGIEVEGDNRLTCQVLPGQWDALVELCAWLWTWGPFDSTQMLTHKQAKGDVSGGTDCPGHLADRMGALVQAVHDRKVDILKGVQNG